MNSAKQNIPEFTSLIFDPVINDLLYNNIVIEKKVVCRSFSACYFYFLFRLLNVREYFILRHFRWTYLLGNMFASDISAIPAPLRKREFDAAEYISLVEESTSKHICMLTN